MKLELFAGTMVKETQRSAGHDVFSAEKDPIIIAPGEYRDIRLGLKTRFDAGYAACLWDKSGYARNNGITVLGGLIDGDYPDEWIAVLLNTGKEAFVIKPGNKVTQVVFFKLADIEPEEKGGTYVVRDNERVGGFGSTGSS